jgi:peptide/nickel transport system substrate-binding protein
MPTNMPFYRASVEKYEYNPAKAKSLIKDLGYFNKVTLTMATSSLVPKQAEIDQAIVGYLKAVGIKVKITKLEVGKFRTTWPDYDISLNTIATFNNDPSFALGIYAGGTGKAVFGWEDAEMDRLFAAQRDDSGATRAGKVNKAQTYLWKMARTLWVSDENWVFIANKRVKNYERSPLVGEALIVNASVS